MQGFPFGGARTPKGCEMEVLGVRECFRILFLVILMKQK